LANLGLKGNSREGLSVPVGSWAAKPRIIFGSELASAEVGRVSPRPQDRGRNCTLLGREPLRKAKEFGLTVQWVAADPAVSERRALPLRSPARYLS